MLYLYESSSPLPTLSLPLRSATISASTRKTPGVDVQGASKEVLLTLLQNERLDFVGNLDDVFGLFVHLCVVLMFNLKNSSGEHDREAW